MAWSMYPAQNMDRDYLPSFKGLVEVGKHVYCALFSLYSLEHVGSQGLHMHLAIGAVEKNASCIVPAFPVRSPMAPLLEHSCAIVLQ
jgi:hypothetical protein